MRSLRGPGRPPKPNKLPTILTTSSKSVASTSRSAPYDRSHRHQQHQPRNNLMAATQHLSFRIPSSSSRHAPTSNSSPLAHRSNSSASTLLRRAAHNALAAEDGSNPTHDNGDNSQLLDALSKMSRALRLSSEAFQLLADYQRGRPPQNVTHEALDEGTSKREPMVLE